ncbi:DMT family transporter [Streptomyces buecherae]|uniref:DMT family transporter n=1 Tax=Streptomyces buecherae TaxID=2763006 RepID=UPI003649AEE5
MTAKEPTQRPAPGRPAAPTGPTTAPGPAAPTGRATAASPTATAGLTTTAGPTATADPAMTADPATTAGAPLPRGGTRAATPTAPGGVARRLSRNPRLLAVAGAACISVSAMLVRLSATSPETAAFFRCALALPLLLPLALRERRRLGPRPARHAGIDLLAGVLLGADLVLWGASIPELGAGIATVIVNVQVVIVPLLALLLFGERLSRRFALTVPVMLAGVALAGGVAEAPGTAGDPVRGVLAGLGAGVAYAGYLFLLRGRGAAAGPRYRFLPVTLATVTAGALPLLVGLVRQDLDLTPGWPAFGWLATLAVTGQFLGWLLIGAALPRLPAKEGGSILLVQPVLAVLLGMALLGERLSGWQVAGCVIVVLAVWDTTRARQPAAEPAPRTHTRARARGVRR